MRRTAAAHRHAERHPHADADAHANHHADSHRDPDRGNHLDADRDPHADAIAIGEDIDGDGLLLLNSNDGAVFAFVADGMYLERCAASFDELLAKYPGSK